jgi:hypothetical protein
VAAANQEVSGTTRDEEADITRSIRAGRPREVTDLQDHRDADMVSQVAGGSETAFSELFRRYAPVASGVAYRVLGDQAQAERSFRRCSFRCGAARAFSTPRAERCARGFSRRRTTAQSTRCDGRRPTGDARSRSRSRSTTIRSRASWFRLGRRQPSCGFSGTIGIVK